MPCGKDHAHDGGCDHGAAGQLGEEIGVAYSLFQGHSISFPLMSLGHRRLRGSCNLVVGGIELNLWSDHLFPKPPLKRKIGLKVNRN